MQNAKLLGPAVGILKENLKQKQLINIEICVKLLVRHNLIFSVTDDSCVWVKTRASVLSFVTEL